MAGHILEIEVANTPLEKWRKRYKIDNKSVKGKMKKRDRAEINEKGNDEKIFKNDMI